MKALNRNGIIKKILLKDSNGIELNFNSPNDIDWVVLLYNSFLIGLFSDRFGDPRKAVHQRTGDIYFTDPIFGRMTFNANNGRGNLEEICCLDQPGFSGIYQYHAKSGFTSIGNN